MCWNYRIWKEWHLTSAKKNQKDGEWEYSIRETYYNSKKEVTNYTINPSRIIGDNPEDIKWTLKKMMRACEKEVLEEGKVKLGKEDN